MKIIYYDPDTKEITMMAHNVLEDEPAPYIEITDEQVEWIKSCNMHVGLFFVDNDTLKKKQPNPPLPLVKPIVNYCYNIPLINQNPIDLLCRQYRSKKELHVSLHNQSDLDIGKIVNAVTLVACKNNDANYPLWYFNIPPNTLSSEPVIYNYKGEDDFRLYTYKTFDGYLHEQHD
jgi:hypothetical protein